MANEAPKWKGLFDWSMKYQDGTHPSSDGLKPVAPEDAKWFREAMAHYMQDFTERMRIIKGRLDSKGGESGEEASLQEKEHLLDELIEIVESIDYARDLRTIGGLPTLLGLLEAPEPSLRWRSAEVMATCAQSNPPVQQWFMEAGAMAALMGLLGDADSTVRQKGLMALSCMLRHNQPGLAAFVQAQGIPQLIQALGDSEPRVQRKALQMLRYTLRERPSERGAAGESGLIPRLVPLLDSPDNDIREAALGVAELFAEPPEQVQYLHQAEGFVPKVQSLHDQLNELEGDDLLAVLESATLATSLATVLSKPRAETPVVAPGAPGGDGSPRRDAAGQVVGGVGSDKAVTGAGQQEQQKQPPLLLAPP